MKRLVVLLLIAAGIILASQPGFSAPVSAIYVSPSGNDSNPGTAQAPFKTIARAVLALPAGGTVYVSSGNYPESVMVPYDGIALIGSLAQVRSIALASRHGASIQGFIVTGPKVLPSNWQNMPHTVVDDPSIVIVSTQSWTQRWPLVSKKYATYEGILNNWNGPNYSLFTEGVYIRECSDVSVKNCTISLHTVGIAMIGSSSNISLDSNSIFYCLTGIWSNAGAFAPSAISVSSCSISRNHCYQNFQAGIRLGSASGCDISSNTCEYSGIYQIGLNSGTLNSCVNRNLGRHGGYYAETMQNPGPSAFTAYQAGLGNSFIWNTAYDQLDATGIDGNGFIADTCPYPVAFTHNTALQNAGAGISFTVTPGCVASGNALTGNKYALGLAQGSGGGSIVANIFSGSKLNHVQTGGYLNQVKTLDYNHYAPGAPLLHDSYNSTRIYTMLSSLRILGWEKHGTGP